jgi:ribosomal-protein-alanine N-acetyltransferase
MARHQHAVVRAGVTKAARVVESSDDFWLTTERLGLRLFTAADLGFLTALYGDPDVARYLGGVRNRAQTAELLETRILRYYDDHPGLGVWKTIHRATRAPVGFHLLNHIQGETIIQVGYVLEKSAWGRGYATEMAQAVLGYGFLDVKLPRIAAMTSLDNRASQHVLEKIGLHRHGERSFTHPAYAAEGPMAWFEREASEWINERGRDTVTSLPSLG